MVAAQRQASARRRRFSSPEVGTGGARTANIEARGRLDVMRIMSVAASEDEPSRVMQILDKGPPLAGVPLAPAANVGLGVSFVSMRRMMTN